LFSLIGTTYGGDGVTTFALPNLLGRVPIHQGNSYGIGQIAGEEVHTLLAAEVPTHTHTLYASTGGTTTTNPSGKAPDGAASIYSKTLTSVPMANNTLSVNQGVIPHNNLMPFQAINFIISLFGIFPSRN